MHEYPPPRRVVVAVGLYLLSLALGFLTPIVVPLQGPFWITAVILLIMFLLALALWRGRNWARIVFLVFFLIGLSMVFGIQEQLAQRGTSGVAIFLTQTLLQAISLVLLFTGGSGNWYRRRTPAAEQSAESS